MASRIIPISALLAGIALLLLGSGLFGTLLAIRGGIEGFSDVVLGLVMSAYFVGFLVGTAVCPSIIARVGHIRAFAIFAAVASTTGVLHAIWVDPWFWALLRMLTGISIVGLYNVVESWLTRQATSDTRGGIFAVYMVVNLLALAAGQWLILLAPVEGHILFSIVTVLIVLSLVPVAMTRLAQPEATDAPPVSLMYLYDVAPVAIVGSFASGLVMGAFWGMGPLFAQRIGLEAGGVALLMSLTIVGGAALQLPIGRYSDNHDRRRVVAKVSAYAAVVAVLVALTLHAFSGALYPLMFVYGGLAFALYPLCVAHLADWIAPEEMLGGSSRLLLLHGGGAALGPVLAGVLMGVLGSEALPLYFAVLLIPMALFAARHSRPQVEDVIIADEQSSQFVPMVRTSPVALELLTDEDVLAQAEAEHTAADIADVDVAASAEGSGPTPPEPAPAAPDHGDDATLSRTGQP